MLRPVAWLAAFVIITALTTWLPLLAAPAPYLAPTTRKMASLLEEMANKADPMLNPFLSAGRASFLEQQAAKATTPDQQLDIQTRLPVELLNAGRTERALEEFDRLERLLTQRGLLDQHGNKSLLRIYQAVAHLRLGEQDNCLAHHTPESCLFPIQGGGVHQLDRGSRGALGVLTNYLAETPGDLSARWLLNVAHMTLGEYPDSIPTQWLIPPTCFSSDADIGRFPEVASIAGLDVENLSGGSIMEDFDGDGFLDIMVSSLGLRDPLQLFWNNGDGTFTESSREAGLIGITGGLNLIQADYNNDGHIDVLVLRGGWMGAAGAFPNSLLRNNGNRTFDDVTEAAGLLSFHPTQTGAWLDYNLDGWLDLFIGNESTTGDPHPCQLYRNNRDGTFTECAAESGVAHVAYVKGVAAGDYNNDGRPDLYLSCLAGRNALFRNDGPSSSDDPSATWRFNDVARRANVHEPFNSFLTWFFDYDNDGWPDLFVAGYKISGVGNVAADVLGLPHTGERARLFRNKGDGSFTDVTRSTGLHRILHAMGGNFGDLDNDGWLDFYLGTGDPDLSTLIPNRMFRNHNGQSFQDVTTSGGFGHLQKGHGVSFGDIDNDGDQDVYEDLGGAYSGDVYRNVLFLNPGHHNRWISIQLVGIRSNRSAIGARLHVTCTSHDGTRSIHRTIGSGGSFGASPLRAEIGLGQATAIDSIKVTWPGSGQTQTFNRIQPNQFIRITQGNPDPVQLDWKSFHLTSSENASTAHPRHTHQHPHVHHP
jgi:hypothetical protein